MWLRLLPDPPVACLLHVGGLQGSEHAAVEIDVDPLELLGLVIHVNHGIQLAGRPLEDKVEGVFGTSTALDGNHQEAHSS